MKLIDAASVAETVSVLETNPSVPARFAPVTTDRHRNPFLDHVTEPKTVHLYRFRDVVLDRATMVLIKDGRIIRESVYVQPDETLAAVALNTEPPTPIEAPFPLATCFDHWDTNYWHWMAHAVPTIHALLGWDDPTDDGRAGVIRPVAREIRRRLGSTRVGRVPPFRPRLGLIVPHLNPWQQWTLRAMRASALPLFPTDPDRRYAIRDLIWCDLAAGAADFALSPLTAAAHERLAATVPASTGPRRRIHIDRTATQNRRIPNEDALIARLAERGFTIMRPETLSLDQQITQFRDAAMVVGQLGAGMANIAFCQPGTIIYELVPDHHAVPIFVSRSMQAGLRYWADQFPTGVATRDHVSPWSLDIDIDHVLTRIEELERTPA